MEQLNQIITEKLKLINYYRTLPQENLLLDRQLHANQLLKEKRKENSRQVLESRLLQSLSSRKIEAPYRIEEFLRESYTMLKHYDPTLHFDINEEEATLKNIVNLYAHFFREQSCERRAEQLLHIYNKSLCEKGLLIPTVMNWFTEWLRKQFKDFLKKTLAKLSSSDRQEKEKRKKLLPKGLMEELQKHQASITKIEQEIEIHKSLTKVRSKLLQPEASPIEITKKSLSNHRRNQSLLIPMSPPPPSKISQPRIEPLPRSSSITDVAHKQGPFTVRESNGPIYNKQMFFSAHCDQLGEYFRMFSLLSDLDMSYPRSFRRVDRREQMKTKYLQIAKSFARAQPWIKKSQQEYQIAYEKYRAKKEAAKEEKKKQKQQVKTQRKISKAKEDRSKSQDIGISERDQIDEKSNGNNIFKRKKPLSGKKNEHQVENKSKPKIHSKTMEIQLPEIPRAGNSRYSTISLKKQRYQQEIQGHRKKNRASADLYKDMNEIKLLFNRNSSMRLQLSARGLEEKRSSFSNYLQLQILQANEQDGVFRLPKIGK